MVKKANFARNASKWKHEDGGPIDPSGRQSPIYAEGGLFPMINSPMMVHFRGPKHEEGGQTLYQNGQPIAEVEGGETMKEGFVYSDKLKVPGTNTTFAKMSKKYTETDPLTKKGDTRMLDKLREKNQALIDQKEAKKMRKGGYVPKAEDGLRVQPYYNLSGGAHDTPTEDYLMSQPNSYSIAPYANYMGSITPSYGIPQNEYPKGVLAPMTSMKSIGYEKPQIPSNLVSQNTNTDVKKPVSTESKTPYNWNNILELAPAAYNAGMALSKQNYLPEDKYSVTDTIPYRKVDRYPMKANVEREYRIANRNARELGNTGTGQYISRNLSNQAQKINAINNLELQSQLADNSMMTNTDMFNIGNKRANKQQEFAVMDYNNRLLGAKQNFGAAAATNAGQYGANRNRYGMIDTQMANQAANDRYLMELLGETYYMLTPEQKAALLKR
jgi:hypothetical protein